MRLARPVRKFRSLSLPALAPIRLSKRFLARSRLARRSLPEFNDQMKS
jgi:hypothetical protein